MSLHLSPARKIDTKAAGREIAKEVMRDDTPTNPLTRDLLGGLKAVRFNVPLRSREELERHLRLMILELTDLLDRTKDRKIPEDGMMLMAQNRFRQLHSKMNPPGDRSLGGGKVSGG